MGRPISVCRGVVVAMVVLAVSACSSGGDDEVLAIDLIEDAIAAADEQYSGSSEFYEINATSDGVNLFISTVIDESTPGVVQARFTSDDGLVVASETVPSEGVTFSGDAVDFDPASIIQGALDQLSSSEPRVFIITGTSGIDGDDVGVSYRLVMESQRGGRLVVFLGDDGTILGSDVLD